MRSSPRPSSSGAAARGVQRPENVSASRFLHDLLRTALARFPALAGAQVPEDPEAFRRGYAETLVRFEAARVASGARAEVAACIADGAHGAFRMVDAEGRAAPLAEWMAAPAEPFAVRRAAFGGKAGLVPRVAYRGTSYEGRALERLGDELVGRRVATRAAADALAALTEDGRPLDLTGRRFAVLGAGAELSPATLLLAAGAEVLWLDVAPPPVSLLASTRLAGSLTWVEAGVDLLAAPERAARTIAEFAGDAGAHLVLSAYAPGGGREWRLAAAMNAIVRAVPPARVLGVGVYVSPTTPCVLDDADRAHDRRGWQRALAAAGALRPSPHVRDDVRIARALVPIQGVGYQAAQYVEKTLAAERFAALGTRDGGAPLRVSANVAPITATRSLEHPLFRAGFLGAARFGVEIFEPETTRTLGALLLVADLIGSNGDDAGAPGRPSGRHVHGGVHSMPYALDEAIRVAAVLGFAERPGLLRDLVRSRLGRRAQA